MSKEEIKATGPHFVPSFQYFYKPLEAGGSKVAVILMNHGDIAADLRLDFADVPGLACSTCDVRDVWGRMDLGTAEKSFFAKAVGSHDCAFLIITPASAGPMVVHM